MRPITLGLIIRDGRATAFTVGWASRRVELQSENRETAIKAGEANGQFGPSTKFHKLSAGQGKSQNSGATMRPTIFVPCKKVCSTSRVSPPPATA